MKEGEVVAEGAIVVEGGIVAEGGIVGDIFLRHGGRCLGRREVAAGDGWRRGTAGGGGQLAAARPPAWLAWQVTLAAGGGPPVIGVAPPPPRAHCAAWGWGARGQGCVCPLGGGELRLGVRRCGAAEGREGGGCWGGPAVPARAGWQDLSQRVEESDAVPARDGREGSRERAASEPGIRRPGMAGAGGGAQERKHPARPRPPPRLRVPPPSLESTNRASEPRARERGRE